MGLFLDICLIYVAYLYCMCTMGENSDEFSRYDLGVGSYINDVGCSRWNEDGDIESLSS